MLNEQKVKLMTKLALYEQDAGKNEIPMSKYYKGDYVSIHMISTAIISSIAFALLTLLWFIFKIDYFMEHLSSFDLFETGRQALIIYVAFLIVNLVIAYIVYSLRFKKVRDRLREYNADLKKLNKFYSQ